MGQVHCHSREEDRQEEGTVCSQVGAEEAAGRGRCMTDKETIEGLALQVEQLSEDVRALTYTVQDLVTVIEESVALIPQ